MCGNWDEVRVYPPRHFVLVGVGARVLDPFYLLPLGRFPIFQLNVVLVMLFLAVEATV